MEKEAIPVSRGNGALQEPPAAGPWYRNLYTGGQNSFMRDNISRFLSQKMEFRVQTVSAWMERFTMQNELISCTVTFWRLKNV